MKNNSIESTIWSDGTDKDKIGTLFYFVIATIEIIGEFMKAKPILYIFKPLLSVLMLFLYWNNSKVRNPIFFGIFLFSLITNIFFISNTKEMLFFGMIALLVYRGLMVAHIITVIKPRDFIPIGIAMVPFVFIFFYLFSISTEIPENSRGIIIIQNILVAIFGGIAFSDYVMNGYKNSWLLICSILSVSHYFIIFIEKYYMLDSSQTLFRPLAMILNALLYYSFYRWAIYAETAIASDPI